MSVTLVDIAALKAIRPDASPPILRFVNSKLSWYQSDSTSTATADEDIVVAPNLGTGRWLKQFAALQVGLAPLTITSDTNVSTGVLYNIEQTTPVTLTLPATAPIGAQIGFYTRTGTTVVNRLIFNLNGRAINGNTTNREIVKTNVYLELKYISDAIGWVIVTEHPDGNLIIVRTSFACPFNNNSPYITGHIMHYLGTQKNALSYLSPHLPPVSGRATRLQYFFGCNNTNQGSAGVITSLGTDGHNSSVMSSMYLVTTVASYYMCGHILIDFLATGSIRPDGFVYTVHNNATSLAASPGDVQIFGANTNEDSRLNNILVANPNTLDITSTGALGNRNALSFFSDLTYLGGTGFHEGNMISQRLSLTGSGSQPVFTNVVPLVGVSQFYRYIFLLFDRNPLSGVVNNRLYWNNLDFYGDVITA